MANYKPALDLIKSLLEDPAAFRAGTPVFGSVTELHDYLTAKGFNLPDGNNTAYGPPDDPDARQLVYNGPNNIIIKLKTAGYASGPRRGRATMSIEVADGRGSAWENTLFKVDANGKIIAKNVIDADATLVRLPTGEWGVQRASGEVQKIVKFEVILGGKGPPFNKQAWADRGHLDLPARFNRAGAATVGKASGPTAGPAVQVLPGANLAQQSRLRGIVGNQAAMALLGQLLGSAIQGIGDLGIQRNIQEQLRTTHAAAIDQYLSQGYGVLIIIRMQEWETPDFNGMRGRGLLGVHVEGGPTQAAALNKWRQRKFLQGPPEGWRTYEEYSWIDPRR
jgi:hypothetical protein